MFAGARLEEVIHHRLVIFECTRSVGPQVSTVRLAVAGPEHLHRRLVGMQHAVLGVNMRSSKRSVRMPETGLEPSANDLVPWRIAAGRMRGTERQEEQKASKGNPAYDKPCTVLRRRFPLLN